MDIETKYWMSGFQSKDRLTDITYKGPEVYICQYQHVAFVTLVSHKDVCMCALVPCPITISGFILPTLPGILIKSGKTQISLPVLNKSAIWLIVTEI